MWQMLSGRQTRKIFPVWRQVLWSLSVPSLWCKWVNVSGKFCMSGGWRISGDLVQKRKVIENSCTGAGWWLPVWDWSEVLHGNGSRYCMDGCKGLPIKSCRCRWRVGNWKNSYFRVKNSYGGDRLMRCDILWEFFWWRGCFDFKRKKGCVSSGFLHFWDEKCRLNGKFGFIKT